MKRGFVSAFVVAAGLGLAGAAQAGPAYTSDDIVKHFAVDESSTGLGAPRALCIGSDSECAKSIPTVAKPKTGFDLVVNFDYNSDVLTPSAKVNLDEFARALRDPRLGRMSFVVEGHTDAKGSDGFNLDLSARRAKSVVKYLNSRGVETAKLESKGLGKENPIGNPMDPGNRRVETRLRAD